MKISVIVPTLNNATLPATLEAIGKQTRPADEVVVVGRDEPNYTAPFSFVRFVDTGKPVCAARARNLGMEAAVGDLFVFTDSDCIPAPDWLEKHEQQAQNYDIVGGGIDIENKNYWAMSDNLSMFHEFSTAKDAGERFLLPTLNMNIKREAWEKVGGMDETFPGAAGEDSDWTIRLRLAGYTLFFDPTIVVRHAPARTTPSDVVRHWKNSGYNNSRVRVKHAAEFGTPWFTRKPFWLRALSPLIAAYISGGIFAQKIYWRYWTTLPIVYATKVIYCWAAARSIEDGFAHS